VLKRATRTLWIVQNEVRSSTGVIISAHGNSLRAFVKYVDDVSDVDINKNSYLKKNRGNIDKT
jgi:bisphosphoglycerate-dependent phosphoglycerate mutase